MLIKDTVAHIEHILQQHFQLKLNGANVGLRISNRVLQST